MKNKYKVHLKSGIVIKFRADDFIIKHRDGQITEWEVIGANRWFMFMPGDLLAVERL